MSFLKIAGIGAACAMVCGCARLSESADQPLVSVSDVNQHIACVLRRGVLGTQGRPKTWMKDWVATATLSRTSERNTRASVGTSPWNIPLLDGNTMAATTSVGLEHMGRRNSSIDKTFSMGALMERSPAYCADDGSTIIGNAVFSGDLGLPQWLDEIDKSNTAQSPTAIDKFGHQVVFAVKVSASVNLSIPMTNVTLVPTGSGDNTDTYDLGLAFTYINPHHVTPRVYVVNIKDARSNNSPPTPGERNFSIVPEGTPEISVPAPAVKKQSKRPKATRYPDHPVVSDDARARLDSVRLQQLLNGLKLK